MCDNRSVKEGWGISNPGDPVIEQVNILRLNLYVPQILIMWRVYTEHTYADTHTHTFMHAIHTEPTHTGTHTVIHQLLE